MKKDSPLIILPIEIWARESVWKLHFAQFCVQNGYKVLVANQIIARDVASACGKASIFVGKHFFIESDHQNRAAIKPLIDSSVNIIFLDEEGGIGLTGNPSEDSIFKQRLPFSLFDKPINFLHWGRYQQSLAQTFDTKNKHIVVGWPALDSIKISRESKQVSENSTNLLAGHVTGERSVTANFLKHKYDNNWRSTRNNLEYDWNEIMYWAKDAYYDAFINNLIAALKSNHIPIEYRPHPSADFAYYRRLMHGIRMSNAKNEPINNVLMRSKTLIHAGCSTAIQAHFMGVPVVNIESPHFRGQVDTLLSSNLKVDSLESLINLLKKTSDELNSVNQAKITDFGKRVIDNLDKNDLSAFKKILNCIQETNSFTLNDLNINCDAEINRANKKYTVNIKRLAKNLIIKAGGVYVVGGNSTYRKRCEFSTNLIESELKIFKKYFNLKEANISYKIYSKQAVLLY